MIDTQLKGLVSLTSIRGHVRFLPNIGHLATGRGGLKAALANRGAAG